MTIESKETLGQALKAGREVLGFTLRTVEEVTDISNAYLSQLENDKIKKPSPNIIHKLANLYRLDFNHLLSLAGIVEYASNENKSYGDYIFSSENLTAEEQEELISYLKFIRDKKRKK